MQDVNSFKLALIIHEFIKPGQHTLHVHVHL